MDLAEKTEYLELLEAKKRLSGTNKITTYYPDEGPLRRELYVKHCAFFDGGIKHRERLMLAANRVGKCIASDTLIESPYHESRKVKDIKGSHWVWAWNGSKRVPALATEPFTKPSEMVYRVWIQSGQYVDCAAEHRFLSEAGWIFLSDLFGCVPCLPRSTSDIGPLESLEDVLRLMNTNRDSLSDCHLGYHSNDEQLPSCQENDLSSFPLLNDALKHILVLSRLDVLVGKCRNILSQVCVHPSIQYVMDLFLAPFSVFEKPIVCNDGLQYLETRQESLLFSDELTYPPRLVSSKEHRQSLCKQALITPFGLSDMVICYQPISIQPIYDFHVPKYLNYCTAGMIHHNTEGVGGYEMTLHLTGLYPAWWKGRRFDRPIKAWASGDSGKTTRDIIQNKLLGQPNEIGTGLIPKASIVDKTSKQGVPDAVDTVYVRHSSGGTSQLIFKSYDQKRKAFEGTEQDVIWLDEEPPLDVYTECLLRTMTNNGMIMLTFTPLLGMSETVLSFLPGGKIEEQYEGSKLVVMATWDDAPHLSDEVKKELWNAIPPFQRDARSKGVPQLGSGAIFPVPESDIVVKDFELPDHWPRGYGLDVGWNRTSAGFHAWDRENDVVYRYSEHYRGQAEPSIHAEGIKSRGPWIPGVVDPAARGRTQTDGRQLLQSYIELGLDLEPAFNGVESGLYEMWQRMSTGRYKVFSSCQNWLAEFRLYRRDEKGQVVKGFDHAMDDSRYFIMSGLERSKIKPADPRKVIQLVNPSQGNSWMG